MRPGFSVKVFETTVRPRRLSPTVARARRSLTSVRTTSRRPARRVVLTRSTCAANAVGRVLPTVVVVTGVVVTGVVVTGSSSS